MSRPLGLSPPDLPSVWRHLALLLLLAVLDVTPVSSVAVAVAKSSGAATAAAASAATSNAKGKGKGKGRGKAQGSAADVGEAEKGEEADENDEEGEEEEEARARAQATTGMLNEASKESPSLQDLDETEETEEKSLASSAGKQHSSHKKLMRQEEDSSVNEALVQHQNAMRLAAERRQKGLEALEADSTSTDELISQVSETAPSALDKVGDDCAELYKIRGAESIQPLRMGLFFKQGSKPLWKNTNEEYLYYSTQFQEWRIGEDYKKELAGVVSTPHEEVTCPHQATGWYAFHSAHWTSKFKIIVSAEPCPSAVTVSGAEDSQRTKMGKFYMTLHVQDGRAVYENSNHMFLYYWAPFQAWRIGNDWTKAPSGMASQKGEGKQCPTDATQWSVFQKGKWAVASLKVQAVGKISESSASSTTSSKTRRGHIVGKFGSTTCPPGSVPLTERECKLAANASHRVYSGNFAMLGKPKGCFQASGSDGDVTFNSHVDGVASESAAPLCKERGLPTDEFEAARSMSPASQDDRGDIRPIAADSIVGAAAAATTSADSSSSPGPKAGFSMSLGSDGTGSWSWLLLLLLFLLPPTAAMLWMQHQQRKEAKTGPALLRAASATEPQPQARAFQLRSKSRSPQQQPQEQPQNQPQRQLQAQLRPQPQLSQLSQLPPPQEQPQQQEQEEEQPGQRQAKEEAQSSSQSSRAPMPTPMDGAGLDMGTDSDEVGSLSR